MSDFWTKKTQPIQTAVQEQPVEIDEEAMTILQENPNVDLDLGEDDDDMSDVMVDANLRLEMGRLYQMILQNDIFAETNADPRAIKNVQREIRRLVREKMEVMLGIRQEQQTQQTIVSSPFNDLEVTALKMVASKVTKGATEAQPVEAVPAAVQPKKDGITSISGNLRPQAPAKLPAVNSKPIPAKVPVKAPVKTQPTKARSAINAELESALTKPIDQMTSEELAAHNKAAEARSMNKKAAIPQNLLPHPSPQALEMMYMNMGQSLNVSSMRPYRIGE